MSHVHGAIDSKMTTTRGTSPETSFEPWPELEDWKAVLTDLQRQIDEEYVAHISDYTWEDFERDSDLIDQSFGRQIYDTNEFDMRY